VSFCTEMIGKQSESTNELSRHDGNVQLLSTGIIITLSLDGKSCVEKVRVFLQKIKSTRQVVGADGS
jgi:hypothetical protein